MVCRLTYAYAAPEQMATSQVCAASDVWAVAKMLLVLMVGNSLRGMQDTDLRLLARVCHLIALPSAAAPPPKPDS